MIWHRRYILAISLLIAVVTLGGCRRQHDDEVDSTLEAAAMEIYDRYASTADDLTVAYIGDFEVGERDYYTVVFHAESDERWEWLQDEFAMGLTSGMMTMDAIAGGMIVAVGMPSLGATIDDVEMLEKFTDSLMRGGNDDELVLVGDEALKMLGLSSEELLSMLPDPNDTAWSMADKPSYVVKSNTEEQTLYLFFYKSIEEMMDLMINVY